jgi:ATP-dependent 26S proteasome regulatory subunit
MDPALLNRCSAIEVPVPDEEAKEEILKVHTRKIDLEDSVNLQAIVEEMNEGFTGRDIKQIVRQASINALDRSDQYSDAKVDVTDFTEAIKDLEEGNVGVEKDFLGNREGTPDEMFA